jgi:hypothetical protein
MAKELLVGASIDYHSGDVSITEGQSVQLNVTGKAPIKVVQTVGTSVEAVTVTDVGSNAYVLARNLDRTNYVTLRSGAAGADLILLKPNGAPALFQLPTGATLYAIANTAACDILFVIVPS